MAQRLAREGERRRRSSGWGRRRLSHPRSKGAHLLTEPGIPIGGILPPHASRRYSRLQLLGRGGLGTVYRALDLQLQRHVAIKLIRPGRRCDEAVLRRFRQEARLLSRLSHAHLVRLYDFGDGEDRLYTVMEYLEGLSLAERIDRAPLPLQEAVSLVADLAEALQTAHRAGVLHRDLKPANVIFHGDGRAMLVDFGLATAWDCSDEKTLTRTGVLAGTPRFLPPEVLAGRPHAPAGDIWQLGLLLYMACAGRYPTEEGALGPVLHWSGIEALPPLGRFRPDVDPVLLGILRRCLSPKPEERPRTAALLAAELRRWPEGERASLPTGTLRAPSKIRRRAAFLSAMVCVLALAMALWPRMPAFELRDLRIRHEGTRLVLSWTSNRPCETAVAFDSPSSALPCQASPGLRTVHRVVIDGSEAGDGQRLHVLFPDGGRSRSLALNWKNPIRHFRVSADDAGGSSFAWNCRPQLSCRIFIRARGGSWTEGRVEVGEAGRLRSFHLPASKRPPELRLRIEAWGPLRVWVDEERSWNLSQRLDRALESHAVFRQLRSMLVPARKDASAPRPHDLRVPRDYEELLAAIDEMGEDLHAFLADDSASMAARFEGASLLSLCRLLRIWAPTAPLRKRLEALEKIYAPVFTVRPLSEAAFAPLARSTSPLLAFAPPIMLVPVNASPEHRKLTIDLARQRLRHMETRLEVKAPFVLPRVQTGNEELRLTLKACNLNSDNVLRMTLDGRQHFYLSEGIRDVGMALGRAGFWGAGIGTVDDVSKALAFHAWVLRCPTGLLEAKAKHELALECRTIRTSSRLLLGLQSLHVSQGR